MSRGLLIDHKWCSGCHSCEMACRMEHGLPDDQYGIKINEMIWPIEGDTWEYTYLAAPTDQCDGCKDRVAKGKLPTCVQHCQSQCICYGSVEELTSQLDEHPRSALFLI